MRWTTFKNQVSEVSVGVKDVDEDLEVHEFVARNEGMENPHIIALLQDWAEDHNAECRVKFGKFVRLEGDILKVHAGYFSLEIDFSGEKRDDLWQLSIYFAKWNSEDFGTLLHLKQWVKLRRLPIRFRPSLLWFWKILFLDQEPTPRAC